MIGDTTPGVDIDDRGQGMLHVTDDDLGKQFRARIGVITTVSKRTPVTSCWATSHPYTCDNGVTVRRNGRAGEVGEGDGPYDLVERIVEVNGVALSEDDIVALMSAGCTADGIQAERSTFITKDSGKRESFSSGMVRDTGAGKMRPDLVRDGPMFMRWVLLLTRGARKYAPGNWLKATGRGEYERFLESTDRHYTIWYHWRKYGINLEDMNNPTREPLTEDHAAAIFFNVNGVEYVAEKIETDATPAYVKQ